MIIYKPFQGLKPLWLYRLLQFFFPDDHLQTLSGIETRNGKRDGISQLMMIIYKPFQGLKLTKSIGIVLFNHC